MFEQIEFPNGCGLTLMFVTHLWVCLLKWLDRRPLRRQRRARPVAAPAAALFMAALAPGGVGKTVWSSRNMNSKGGFENTYRAKAKRHVFLKRTVALFTDCNS